MASAVVELTQQSDPKSTMMHAPVDSVPVHNPSGKKDKETARKCNHFTIRGFVSEIRQKDPTLCYPFTLKDSIEPRNELPPMVIPKFRWWQCSSCVPEAQDCQKNSYGTSNEEAQKYNESADADAPIPLVGQSSKANDAARLRTAEASTSTDSNDNRNPSPMSVVCADRKGKGKAHIEDELPPPSVLKNGSLKDFPIREILQQTSDKIAVNLTVEPRARSHANGTIGALYKEYTDRIEAGSSKAHVTHEDNYTTKNCQEKSWVFSGDQHSVPPTNGVQADIVGTVSQPRNQGHLVNLPDLNECSEEPVCEENDDTMVIGNNINSLCEDDDDYLGAERRKKPKVRLLSELLGLKETQISAKAKKKHPPGSSLDDSFKRKRVESQDENSKRKEIRGAINAFKMIIGVGEISESESEYRSDSDTVSTEKISEALAKRRCNSKDSSLERRNKKIKVDHGDSSSMSQQKMKPKSNLDKGKCSEDVSHRRDISSQLIERNSVMTKKRGRVLQVRKDSSSLIPCRAQLPKECEGTQNYKEASDNTAENDKRASDSLLKEHDQHLIPLRKDGLCVPLSQSEMLIEGSRRAVAVGAPATDSQSDKHGEKNISRKANPKEIAGISETESNTLAQRMPLQASKLVVNQKELTNEVRGRIQDIDINSIPADDKTNEQGSEDDIPIEVVELMAKNQYERQLDEPKNNPTYVSSRVPPGTYIRQNGPYGPYGQRVQNLTHSQFISMHPLSTDHRNPVVNGNLGDFSKFSSTPFVVGGFPRENHVYPRFGSPNQGQEHISSYSASSSAHNNWNANSHMAASQRYPPNFLQTVDAYQKQRARAPRQSGIEAPYVWPSLVTSRMPIGITNPQMISQSSNVLNAAKVHHPQSSGSIFSFNTAASNPGTQLNLSFSSGQSSGIPETPAVSVDANEAITASHLLSFIHNAANMQNVDLSLGPQKVVGPSSSRQPLAKNNSRTLQDNSRHPCYPAALPTARPFPSSYQNDGANIGRAGTSFMGPIPLTSRGQRNLESSQFASPGGESRPLRRPMAPPLDKGKGIASASKPSYVSPVQVVKDSSSSLCRAGVRRDERTISLAPDKQNCQLNQNPSEFNDFYLLPQFMIGPEDLKPRKLARDKVVRPRGDAKRQEIRGNKATPATDRTKQKV